MFNANHELLEMLADALDPVYQRILATRPPGGPLSDTSIKISVLEQSDIIEVMVCIKAMKDHRQRKAHAAVSRATAFGS